MCEMTRTLLFSDEPILAKGLESVLASVEGFHLAGVCSGTTKLKEILDAGEPDILLIDLTSDVTFSILSELKKASLNAKIVLWVHSISTELALQAMALGVRGILRKTLPSELLIKCLQRVNEGEFWFEKALTDSFLSAKRIALTKREGQLVSLLSQGLKNKEIASMLLISEGTVKVYLSRLFQKVGVKDRRVEEPHHRTWHARKGAGGGFGPFLDAGDSSDAGLARAVSREVFFAHVRTSYPAQERELAPALLHPGE